MLQAPPFPILKQWAGTTLLVPPLLSGIQGGLPPPLQISLFQWEELGWVGRVLLTGEQWASSTPTRKPFPLLGLPHSWSHLTHPPPSSQCY